MLHGLHVLSPVVTYEEQGVSKRGVVKAHHAIVYTSSTEPQPKRNERPGQGEKPMLPGIRIVPITRTSKVDKMARVDFSRMYSVEPWVEVFDFGRVHQQHMGRLQSHWVNVKTKRKAGSVRDPGQFVGGLSLNEGYDDGGDEAETEEDEEEEVRDDSWWRKMIGK